MLRIFILPLILIFSLSASSQRKQFTEHKIKNIVGIAYGNETQTMEQIKQLALNKAKVEALRKAGISENINSYSSLLRSETNNTMEELFVSDILSDINGIVKNVEIISENPEFIKNNQIKYTITINCTVVKFKNSKDLSFSAWIEGIEPVYKNGAGLSFTVKPTLDCYAHIFIFTSESFILFPNDYEKSFKLEKMKTYAFPNPDIVESYELTIDNKKLNHETDRIVFVLLKEDYHYTGKINYKDITDWIMTIPPNKRFIKSFSFEVYRD